MASIFEYFNNDFKELCLNQTLFFALKSQNKNIPDRKIEIMQRIRHDADSSSRLFTYYIPNISNTFNACIEILRRIDHFKSKANEAIVISSFPDDVSVGLHSIVYSSRIYFYTENELSQIEIKKLDVFCKEKGLFVTIRSKNYVKKHMELEKPLAFISHDSKDKDLIARPLAVSLSSRLCTVWYDEYSLKIGDSLRESIEKGIKEAKKCILILTPNFLNNPGWGKKEFNSIFTREMILNEKIILPIWFNVSVKEIYEYSPALADTFALPWPNPNDFDDTDYKIQVEKIVSKIHTEITFVDQAKK